MKEYSLYIHIPFCKSKCNYCDFTSFAGAESMMPQYVDVLRQELFFYSKALDMPDISTIYFGGGTPTLLNSRDIRFILDYIRSKFALEKNAEISMEANPESVNFAKLSDAKDAGVNRISIGAQTFDDATLKILGRAHTANQTNYAYNTARQVGINNINLDLIFALPDQGLYEWKESLKKALSLNSEHLSIYNLVVPRETPFYSRKMHLNLPSIDTEAEMYEEAIKTLISSGYNHYEISNFSKPGYECMGNMVYWNNKQYIGIGAGATSYIKGHRYSNAKSIEKYIKSWSNDIEGVIEAKLSKENDNINQQISETIFLGLRKINGINMKEINDRFGFNVFEKYYDSLKELINGGFLDKKGSNLKLTKRGLLVADEVFERFV